MQQGLESAAVTGTDRGKPIGGEGLSLTRNAPQPRRESAPAKPMSGTGRDFDQANPAPAEARSKPLVAKGEAARDIKDAPASLVKRKEMNDAVALKQRGEPLQEKEALAKPMAPAPVPEPQPESKKNASALIPAQPEAPPNREVYAPIVDNPFLPAIANPLSTFSIDVDTASYANVRRFLNQNMKPPKDAVRIEEMLNYFPYSDPGPKDDKPFAFNVEIAACPWNAEDRLVRVALKAKEIDANKRPASNLVFLIDVSGSMSDLNKLPLLKAGMKLLIDQLTENDRVAIVVYAGEARVALPSTPCHRKKMIIDVLDSLEAGGSTAGGAGIELAYREAVQHFIKGGTNRVILATDGDFNVGVDKDQLLKTSEERAKTGVFLSVLGFGEGNLQEAFMEQLADKGNGHYAYIDNIAEARKVLVGEMAGTLVTVAKDVKIQVEFNPAKVKAYRLIGYENRVMAAQDFRDDKKDAGEIGAGHGVTALYEITPADAKSNPVGDNLDGIKLKYGRPGDAAAPKPNPAVPTSPESLTVFLRYKAPDGDVAKELEQGVVDKGLGFGQASADFKFSAAVAGFGMLLRDSPYKGSLTFSGVAEYAAGASVGDPTGYRQEFVELVKQAQTVYGQ
jgi:Ca-activated chloride channel family protein